MRRNLVGVIFGLIGVLFIVGSGYYVYVSNDKPSPKTEAVSGLMDTIINANVKDGRAVNLLESFTVEKLGADVPKEKIDSGKITFVELFSYVPDATKDKLIQEVSDITKMDKYVDTTGMSKDEVLALQVWDMSLGVTIDHSKMYRINYNHSVSKNGEFSRSRVEAKDDAQEVVDKLLPSSMMLLEGTDGDWKLPGKDLLNHWESQIQK